MAGSAGAHLCPAGHAGAEAERSGRRPPGERAHRDGSAPCAQL